MLVYCTNCFSVLLYVLTYLIIVGLPSGTGVKISPTNARDARERGLSPGLGSFTGTLKGKQYY